jgi:hypothetical protein
MITARFDLLMVAARLSELPDRLGDIAPLGLGASAHFEPLLGLY